nr:uncharacterized protein LOC111414006 [Onthophagus taurus]
MSESKKMGASKYKNNQKYKNKSKVVPKEKQSDSVDDEDKIVIDNDYPYRRRGLESNWHRYEVIDVPESEEIIDVAKDFSAIVSAPISQGNYFKFKADKSLDNLKDEEIKCEMFKIDMNTLSLGLLSIPFHIRCGIDEKCFSESSLNEILADAESAKINYLKLLKENDEKNVQIKEDESKSTNKILTGLMGDDLNDLIKNDGDNKECSITNFSTKELKGLKEPKEKDDLEKWLDDILDD